MKKYFLTNAEFDVLNHISSEARMDWFYIYDKRDGSIGFKDLEAGTYRSLRIGVAEMDEALTDYEDYNLTEDEIEVYENLKKKLNITEEDVEYDIALGCNEDDYVLASNGNIKIKKSLVYESFRKVGKELRVWFVDEDNPLHTYRVVEVTDNEVIAEFID